MSYEANEGFISYLDESGKQREGYVTILRFDASFIQFRTNSGNVIFIPTSRVLKVKYKGEVEK